jgi:hypothetical protein
MAFFYFLGFQPEQRFWPGLLPFSARPVRPTTGPLPLLLSSAASFSQAQPPASLPIGPWPLAGPARLHPLLSLPRGPPPSLFFPGREAGSSAHAHRPGVPSSPRNGAAPPPLFTPHSPLCFPSHRTRRPALMPPPPAARSPSSSGHPRSPLQPYKRVRSSPILTALIPAPHFPLSAPQVAPHQASPPSFTLHHRRPHLVRTPGAPLLFPQPAASSRALQHR